MVADIRKYGLIALAGLSLILILLLLFYVIPSKTGDTALLSSAQKELDKAEFAFDARYDVFYTKSLNLADSLRRLTDIDEQKDEVNRLFENSDLYGLSLLRNEETQVWKGFAARTQLSEVSSENLNIPQVSLIRESNSVLLSFEYAFRMSVMDSTETYVFISRNLIQQSPIIPGATFGEVSTLELLGVDESSPVHFNFMSEESNNVIDKRALSLGMADTVGYAEIIQSDLGLFQQSQSKRLYAIVSMLVFLLLLSIYFLLPFLRNTAFAFIFVLDGIIISLLWILAARGYFSWPFFDSATSNITQLQDLLVNLAFLGTSFHLASLSLADAKEHLKSGKLSVVLNVGCIMLSALAFFITTVSIIQIFEVNGFSILDLNIIPSLAVVSFYIISSYALLGGMHLLFRPYFDGIRQLMTKFEFITRPRLLIILGILLSGFIYAWSYQAEVHNSNEQVLRDEEHFVNSSIESDQNVIRGFIQNAYAYLSQEGAFEWDGDTRRIQQRLLNGIPFIIEDDWVDYSFDLRLINTEGTELASFSTDLDTPSWTQVFDMSSLEIPYEQEQITRAVNRPIIRTRPFNDLPIKYSAFRRGWIPLYDADSESDRIIAWILCTIYKEPSKFDKPLRSLIATASENENRNNTTFISIYDKEGNRIRSRFYGLPNQLNHSDKLNQDVGSLFDADSLMNTIIVANSVSIQENLKLLPSGQVLKSTHVIPSPENHLFSLTRFFIIVFITGFTVTAIASLTGFNSIGVFGFTRRFQYRLLDRVVYTIILCLVALIVSTSFAVKKQNLELVNNDLSSDLETLVDALLIQSQSEDDTPSLERATFGLDVDATFYQDGAMVQSTAPQMYNQNLLSSYVPYPLYKRLIDNSESIVIEQVSVANQPIMIGYTRLNNSSDILAIPTFLNSPKYTKMFLTSNSYLLAFYVIIFALFIVAATIIAKDLTRPVEKIKMALQTIGEGDLNAKIPVYSEDEIGSLSRAYNEMIDKLRQVQQELAQMEREEAWKEMAQQVAHEIKNPLTPMKLNLQHLERQVANGDKTKEELNFEIQKVTGSIIDQIESLDKIASDFSKFAKPVSGPIEEIDSAKLITEVSALYSNYKKLKVVTNNLVESACFMGNRDEMNGVLINLIKNSIEAMNEKGEIHLSNDIEDNFIIIKVQDNGPGISEEHIEHIFVPNFSTKTSGTGLGLAITKKVIESHEGEIEFQSSDKGTAFTIRIPKS